MIDSDTCVQKCRKCLIVIVRQCLVCFLVTFPPFLFLCTGKPKQNSNKTFFYSTTRSVQVSGAQRTMGTHEPMATVVPTSFRSALLRLKKKNDTFFIRPRTTTLLSPRKMTAPLHPWPFIEVFAMRRNAPFPFVHMLHVRSHTVRILPQTSLKFSTTEPCLCPQKNWTRHSLLNERLACQRVCVCVCVGTVEMSCCYQVEAGRETWVAVNERSLSGRVLSSCVWRPLPSPYQRYGLSQAYVPLRRACTDP